MRLADWARPGQARQNQGRPACSRPAHPPTPIFIQIMTLDILLAKTYHFSKGLAGRSRREGGGLGGMDFGIAFFLLFFFVEIWGL